ncbi:hypothetical protein F511_31567 [Dorcoceras hygrometricum]|uniref:Uncharacterized protein n=1 Tax=Dorcoceras hygrometricum TaxID=472368 RepID=A0A2Z7D606_9LAMI|nr:hypothetical protein F511_31567 [Dorcoceras hygrometricum]
MASSLISRSHHIDFDSVFRFDDAEIVQMFESLVTTGLMEFLGCPAIFHESSLIEFFANGSVRDGMVVSTIGGIAVEIRESVFAETFGLPTEGLTDLSEVPRNLLSEAQSLFSASEKEVSISCLKKEVKMQYRLLSDILAKSLFVKAGSFDANIPGLELGESKAFPAPRILNEKTVHQIVSFNENVGVEEVGEAPRAKKTPVKKTMSKKRQAASEAEVEDTTADEEDSLGGTVGKARVLILELMNQWWPQPILRKQPAAGKVQRLGESSSIRDKGKAILVEDDQLTANPANEIVALVCSDVEFLVRVRDRTILQDLFDIKKTQRAQEAKLNALDGQVAALRNEQLEFQNRISADLLCLSTQFADIVEFIRGDDAKKGEGGSSSRPPPVRVERRPLPTPQSPRDVAGSSSAVRIPTFPRTTGTLAERVEQARRNILESGQFISVEEAAERIRQADFQESDRLQRERERARREKRSSSSRRRRGF